MTLLPCMAIQPIVLGMALLWVAMDSSLSQGPQLWRHNDMPLLFHGVRADLSETPNNALTTRMHGDYRPSIDRFFVGFNAICCPFLINNPIYIEGRNCSFSTVTVLFTKCSGLRPFFGILAQSWFGRLFGSAPTFLPLMQPKNPVSLFDFQARENTQFSIFNTQYSIFKRGKILKKFRLIDHKCKWLKRLCQIVSIMINLSMFYATKTMEQWGPNHENVTLWRDITTFSSLTRDFSANTQLNLPISSTNVKQIFSDLMV